ncbi:hypothetical protein [Rhizobium arsenicireducens]
MNIYENLWGSGVNLANEIIDNRRLIYPASTITFIDWEAHANIHELPETDLIGTTAITITEEEPEVFSFSFTLGISTFGDDGNLFRLRNYVGEAFRRLRPGLQIAYCDRITAEQLGWLHIVDGTVVLPMTRADARPLQFVQCQGIIDPTTARG